MKKNTIKLNEASLRKMVAESVKKILKERSIRLYFDEEKFKEWENNTHIPEKIMNMVRHISEKIGYSIDQEETVVVRNVYGVKIGYGKGFQISHCTSSYADGPSEDYSKEFAQWLEGLGFRIVGSYGDNGMDSATNWHDTFWYHDFVYEPTITYEDFKRFPEDATEDEIEDYYERQEMNDYYGY